MVLLIQKRRKPQEVCLNLHCPTKQNAEVQKEIKQLEKTHTQKTCPKCGKAMVLRTSFYGQFWGCSGYPACRQLENIKEKKE